MKLWADCGRSARDVSGMTGKNTVAKYNVRGIPQKNRMEDEPMEIQKVQMMIDLCTVNGKCLLDIKQMRVLYQEYKKLRTQSRSFPDRSSVEYFMIRKKMSQKVSELDVLSRTVYNKLTPGQQEVFEKRARINRYADPDIGEAYHINTGGNPLPGKKNWNFHWAGVVLKAKGDNVTLENYAVGDFDVENKKWDFQMYGIGKKGQSAHEEHRDIHGQHGDAPTTMTVTRG